MNTESPFLKDINLFGVRDPKCPSCGILDSNVFYEVQNIPVNSVLLMPTEEFALNYPKGDIALSVCFTCGFITNIAFDSRKQEYSSRYEETQGFSQTFSLFHRQLASHLVERYDLYKKDIIEIGCGKGEFLNLICEMGNNRGVGFDPAYVSKRFDKRSHKNTTFIQDFYSEKYASYHGDFYCCKMTLEHIQDTANFLTMIRRSISKNLDVVVFFQVPDVLRILKDLAFWDIYYEHCSYFSPGSLGRLFRRCNFDVIDLWKDFDDQYLMIEARPHKGEILSPLSQEEDLDDLTNVVESFARNCFQKINTWKHKLKEYQQKGLRVVLWGAGSKGVAFLTTLEVQDEIGCAVDINPYKHGTYMAGTGHEIVSPEFLLEYKPDVVIIMNPIYKDEIQKDIKQMGLSPIIKTIDM